MRYNYLVKLKMANSKLKFFIIILPFLISITSVFSQNVSGIKYIGLKDVGELLKMITDKTIDGKFKVLAIERLSEIYKSNPDQAKQQSESFVKAIADAMEMSRNTYHEVRSAGCDALGNFDDSNAAEKAIESIEKVLLNDTSINVVISCSDALGRFKRKSSRAGTALLARLKVNLEAENVDYDSTRVMSSLVKAIGDLKIKQGFIPLMKVLQSRYPVAVKKQAEAAIEKIQWD